MNQRKWRRPKRDPADASTVVATVYLPRSISDLLKARAERVQMPLSRLICYAVDKEFERTDAFEYPTEMPETVFVEHAYSDEASKIFRHIKKFGPASVDSLMLARREIGVPDKITFMLAIREMLHTDLVERVYPSWSRFLFRKDYTVIGYKQDKEDKKQKEIAKLKEKIAELEGGNLE